MSGNLFTGAGYFLRGLTMLSEPGLRRFVIVPLMANIMLFSLMGWLLFEMISDFMTQRSSPSPNGCSFSLGSSRRYFG
ncbi:MAG: hypothetical protein CM15mP74_00520 [Halieaceae bacterium]|nr:MAG: hypothetical protein CM15mP74_00520 [Halieaceae bacterium]